MSIHPSAIIHPDAQVAEDVEVGPFCLVEAHAKIGSGCVLHSHVTVRSYTHMGENNTCHSGAVMGDEPQDLGFDAANISYVKIGNGNTFREGFTAHRGTKEGSETVIGDKGYFMANSHVAHNCQIADQVIMANGALLGGYVEIGERAFISGNAVLHQFIRIGRLAMISGLSALSKDVPPFCTSSGGYRNVIAGLNTVGLKRAGFAPDERNALRKTFREIFMGNQPITDAAKQCKDASEAASVQEICDFILESKRGVCGYGGG